MSAFAGYYDFPITQVTEAFVALSPNNDYLGNLRSLATVLHGLNEAQDPETITVSTYKACRNRAISYLRGEVKFTEKVKGPKITSFRDNILRPKASRRVTVDGHMICIWTGRDMTMKEASFELRGKRHYEQIEAEFVAFADGLGLVPNQLQATLWFTRKRVRNVKYDAQLSLFGSKDDQWNTLCDPADVKPYF